MKFVENTWHKAMEAINPFGVNLRMAPIFLTGFMGSGKTTISRRLSVLMDLENIDLDLAIVREAGMPVSAIFEKMGEVYFRQQEAILLRRFGLEKDVLISTGGGAPCYHQNQRFMLDSGIVVWLHPPMDILVSRLMRGKSRRPLIAEVKTEAEMEERISRMLESRIPYYALADIVVKDRIIDVEALAAEIKRMEKIKFTAK